MPKLGAVSKTSTSKSEEPKLKVETNFTKVKGRNIVLLAPPKMGKTRCAATLSDHWPSSETFPLKERISLEDTLYILTDKTGTSVLKGLNIEVDQFPMYNYFGDGEDQFKDPMKLMSEVSDLILDQIKNNNKKLIILDSGSAWDDMLDFYYEKVNIPRTQQGNRDSFAIHRIMTADHYKVWRFFASLPCDVVFIFHTKTAGDAALKKAKAEGLASGGAIQNIVLDTKFQDTANIYRRQMDIVASIQQEGGQRWLYTKSKNGIEGGNRYEDILPEKVEPNLGKLFSLIDSKINNKE